MAFCVLWLFASMHNMHNFQYHIPQNVIHHERHLTKWEQFKYNCFQRHWWNQYEIFCHRLSPLFCVYAVLIRFILEPIFSFCLKRLSHHVHLIPQSIISHVPQYVTQLKKLQPLMLFITYQTNESCFHISSEISDYIFTVM